MEGRAAGVASSHVGRNTPDFRTIDGRPREHFASAVDEIHLLKGKPHTVSDWSRRMKQTVDHLAEQLSGIRPGKVGVGFLETFRVSIRGGAVPLGKLASMQPRGELVHVTPYDSTAIPAIVKALVDSKLSAYALNPLTVCVSIPPISLEQQAEVATHVKALGNQAKVAIRAIRQDSRKQIEARGRGSFHAVQADTDAAVERIEALVKAKVDELVPPGNTRRR